MRHCTKDTDKHAVPMHANPDVLSFAYECAQAGLCAYDICIWLQLWCINTANPAKDRGVSGGQTQVCGSLHVLGALLSCFLSISPATASFTYTPPSCATLSPSWGS